MLVMGRGSDVPSRARETIGRSPFVSEAIYSRGDDERGRVNDGQGERRRRGETKACENRVQARGGNCGQGKGRQPCRNQDDPGRREERRRGEPRLVNNNGHDELVSKVDKLHTIR